MTPAESAVADYASLREPHRLEVRVKGEETAPGDNPRIGLYEQPPELGGPKWQTS
jgi:hypothetical protein